MAGAFEDYKIGWGKTEYTIPARRVLEVIASVESVVTYGELLEFGRRQTAPFALLSRAYGIILRAAGVRGENGGLITDGEVYDIVCTGLSDNQLLDMINGLFGLMAPPRSRDSKEETAPGNSRRASAKAKASSKPSTKRSSVRAG